MRQERQAVQAQKGHGITSGDASIQKEAGNFIGFGIERSIRGVGPLKPYGYLCRVPLGRPP
jgi:hypothetical protein